MIEARCCVFCANKLALIRASITFHGMPAVCSEPGDAVMTMGANAQLGKAAADDGEHRRRLRGAALSRAAEYLLLPASTGISATPVPAGEYHVSEKTVVSEPCSMRTIRDHVPASIA